MQIVDRVIGSCIELGARLAGRGEFSRRAFLNGKMDLTQIEALADVISAESSAGVALAQRQLKGGLRDRIELFREKLIGSLARMELELDFVEEGYEFASRGELEMILCDLLRSVDGLLAGYRSNDLLRRGARVLLLGRPNAGKSSLFNALIGFDRAIVSGVPGTTRDYVEERISYGGCTFHFIDSAGIRETLDGVEREGVERSYSLVGSVDLVLYVVDGSEESRMLEIERCEELRRAHPQQSVLLVLSKSDLYEASDLYLSCSVRDDLSVTALMDRLVSLFSVDISSDIALLSRRQFQLLTDVRSIVAGISSDVLEQTEVLVAELRRLLVPLGELTGAISSDEILNEIFGAFCIGK
jgi:tRNA modification GTPase